MRCSSAVLLASLVSATVSCAARMQVPDGFDENTNALEVTGRDAADPAASHELVFGSYRAHQIQTGWTTTFADKDVFGGAVADLASFPQDGSYSFAVDTERGPWRAICSESADAVKLLMHEGGAVEATTHTLACVCANLGEKTAAKMQLTADKSTFLGVLSMGQRSFRVRGSRLRQDRDKRDTKPTGYVFSNGPLSVGAVDVLNDGMVWFQPSLTEDARDAIACASVALLLHPSPKARLSKAAADSDASPSESAQ